MTRFLQYVQKLLMLLPVWLFATAAAQTYTWTGAADDKWNTAGNWDQGLVPTSATAVVINSCTRCPVLESNVTTGNLTLNTGAKLSIGGYTFTTPVAYLYLATIYSAGGKVLAGRFSQMYRCDFNGPVTLEKSGAGTDQASGGNRFNGPATINFAITVPDYSVMYMGFHEGDTFNEDVTVNTHSGTLLVMASSYYGGSATVFKKKLTGNANNTPLFFGKVQCEATGSVEFNATWSNMSVSRGNFLGPVSVDLKAARYNGGNSISMENCNFSRPVAVNNTNTVFLQYGFHGIRLGKGTNRCTFSPDAPLTIGAGGFYWGDLVLENCIFQSPAGVSLDLSAGPASPSRKGRIVISTGAIFTGPFTGKAPNIVLNGGIFNQDATFTKTGTGTNNSTGGNIFRRKLTITNQSDATSPMNMATQYDDVVQQ